ncbi:hypothetical protein SAMN05421805_10539 [Saccharopolyspora antimicrobica]|uniref:Uncharacterized protein n=1 Tax=Saccharopolyspora antimicrobica TaxID=455193 RepID=A0A1I4ZM39_9PSEU|nr:hypothetical protein [Saccharopolyspora antimicrobica]RKT83475.1 hypothetical protein ATL45_1759 [Saccharopolyspora antimicrobica]SFN51315.1 hypothetical protein SAMN05421805_10539 [Saccharopolyspora antimicrobica]
MGRFPVWLRSNADGFLALLIAVAVGLIGVLDVFNADQILPEATLLVLALLATTLLRDRRKSAQMLADRDSVRMINGPEVGQVHAKAHRDSEQWMFKGGTGTYLRAVTLPECVESARSAKRPLRMQVEIIDPTDELLCHEYARYRSSLSPGPDRTGEPWTVDRTRKESFATVLAACWYRQRFNFLKVEVGLSKVMTTFRWDLSSEWVLLTQEDPAAPAMLFDKTRPHYRAYNRELMASFEQTRRVDLDRARELTLAAEPTIDETRKLFAVLDMELPGTFTDRDVTDLIRRAIRPKNPYW